MGQPDNPTADQDDALLSVARLYRPEGVRRGILMSPECSETHRLAAAHCLNAAGESPERRLATLYPRVGRNRVSNEEWTDFLAKYGHEYAIVWFPGPMPRAVEAAAQEAGCVTFTRP